MDEATAELGDAAREEPTRVIGAQWPRFVAGSAQDVRATCQQMMEESGADELIVQSMIANPDDRNRSYTHLARAFDLGAG